MGNFLFGRFTIPEDRLHMSPIDARRRSVKYNYTHFTIRELPSYTVCKGFLQDNLLKDIDNWSGAVRSVV